MIARRGCQSVDRATARKTPTSNKKALRRALSRSGGFVLSAILLALPFSWCHEDVRRRKHFVEVNKMLTAEVLRPAGAARSKGLGCFPTRPLCIDKDIACKALCVQKHCLRQSFFTRYAWACVVSRNSVKRRGSGEKSPKGTRTLEQSLVCYTSPGGVDSSGFVRGSRLGRCSGWRSK